MHRTKNNHVKPSVSLIRIAKLGLILLISTVLGLNAIRNIKTSWKTISMYDTKRQILQKQYLQIIKKKNELNYVTSPFYIEQQLRNSLNYYKNGEKVVLFTEPLNNEQPITPTPTPNSKMLWKKVIGF